MCIHNESIIHESWGEFLIQRFLEVSNAWNSVFDQLLGILSRNKANIINCSTEILFIATTQNIQLITTSGWHTSLSLLWDMRNGKQKEIKIIENSPPSRTAINKKTKTRSCESNHECCLRVEKTRYDMNENAHCVHFLSRFHWFCSFISWSNGNLLVHVCLRAASSINISSPRDFSTITNLNLNLSIFALAKASTYLLVAGMSSILCVELWKANFGLVSTGLVCMERSDSIMLISLLKSVRPSNKIFNCTCVSLHSTVITRIRFTFKFTFAKQNQRQPMKKRWCWK